MSANQIEMSEKFADLVFLALDHGVESVRGSGGPLIPFVITEQDGKRELHRYAAEMLEDCERQARDSVASLPDSVTAYAFAYDGFITVQGVKFDAILVEASERGRPAGVRMAQRYTSKAGSRDFQIIGNPTLLGECEGMLR
jgi:hypothetical protein